MPRQAPRGFEPGGGFEAFLGNLTRLQPDQADIHYRPMSRQCGMQCGTATATSRPGCVSYDYVLKTEHMARWYEPFARLLGLEETVQAGWNVSTKWWRGAPPGGCFYAPPGRSCAGMFRDAACAADAPRTEGVDAEGEEGAGEEEEDDDDDDDEAPAPAVPPADAAGAVRPASFHATHAASRRAAFYQGEAARLATDWLREDLQRFQYS